MRQFLHILAAFALVHLAAAAHAQAPIRILHGSNAGAPQDIMLRLLADEMEKALTQRVIVEPRPGAEGQVAMSALKQAPADGMTIFSDGTGITSILQAPDAQHKWTDFEPLYRIQLDPFALYARRGQFATLQDLVAAMKKQPSNVRVGGFAVNGPHRITTMMVAEKAGGTFTWVPYNSGARALTDLLGDHIEAVLSNISVYAGFKERAIVLAHTGEARLPQFPEVPTFKELGIDIVRYHWRGMFVKRGTPEDVINRLFEGIDRAVKSDRFQAYLRDSATSAGTMSRADYNRMLVDQAAVDTVRMKEMGPAK
jgi:putative tricarboxylic transport membrane protein